MMFMSATVLWDCLLAQKKKIALGWTLGLLCCLLWDCLLAQKKKLGWNLKDIRSLTLLLPEKV
jgi:hypothetical protein